MKRLLLCIIFFVPLGLYAQDFNVFFLDHTLRIDYIFSGNVNEQHISLNQLFKEPHWYGKRTRLSEIPMEGNGQITVLDHHSGKIIYRNSFSTLFQEWLSYDEAKSQTRSFENVFLIPMPKDTVDVTIDLRNNRRQITASLTHQIVPNDILIRRIGEYNITPYSILQQAEDTARCIHIAYVAEGYTLQEMNVFREDARKAMGYLFSYEPFKSMRNRFQIVAVESPSQESGTSEPHKGIWKNTALHSHFDTFYSDRYLTTLNLSDLHYLLAGVPYEHIIVLVNTNKYGGGGILNSYNLSMTHHPAFRPVVVHEFGHSFAGLADEYAYDNESIPMYPYDVKPWEKNITTMVRFENKWENLIGQIPQVGFYEGAGYSLKHIYRASHDCRMRTNDYPDFCPACQQAIQQVIDFYTK